VHFIINPMTRKKAPTLKYAATRAMAGQNSSKLLNRLSEDVCSVYDPFCPKAYGSTRPVGSSTPTIPFTLKQVFTVATGAAGDAWFVLYPGADTDCISSFTTVNPNWPAVAAPATSLGSFPSFGSTVRVVSAGLTWHDIAPSTDAGGYVIVMNVSSPSDSMYDGGTHTLSSLINSNETFITDRHQPGTVILSPTNNVQADEFQAAGTAVNSVANPWAAVALAINGKPSTNVLMVTVVVHYELTLNESSIPGTTRPERSLVVTATKSFSNTFINKASEEAGSIIRRKAMGIIKRLAGTAVRAGANYLTGGVSGYLMDQAIPEVV
jgi:hypothetical protein